MCPSALRRLDIRTGADRFGCHPRVPVHEMVARGPARMIEALSNKRLKLAARVDCGMNLSSARRSLSAFR